MSKLDEALKQIEKMYGKGSVMTLDEAEHVDVESISTGSLMIDECLGIGGLPKGKVVEVYGTESSGKTTLTLQTIAECQKKGGKVAFIDAENALDPVYAGRLGVDLDKVIFAQPTSGEEALSITEILVKSGEVSLIVIDSVAALTPQAELDGEMGDQNIGLLSRLMSKAMRKLVGAANESGCTIVFINQVREKIGAYGNPETTTGGRALKFYSSVRIEMRKGEAIKQGTDVIGNKVKVKIVKNKVAAPYKQCEVSLVYGEGISAETEIIEMAIARDIIHKAGSWFSYEDEKIGQGMETVKKWLKENPDKKTLIANKIRGYDPETGEVFE